MENHHRDNDWLCHLLCSAKEFLIRNPRTHSPIWDYEDGFWNHHDFDRSHLWGIQVCQRHNRRQVERPVAHGDRPDWKRHSQHSVRVRGDYRHFDDRLVAGSCLCQRAGRVFRRAADPQQRVPRLRIPSLQQAHHALGGSERARHENVSLEHIPFNRGFHRLCSLWMAHGTCRNRCFSGPRNESESHREHEGCSCGFAARESRSFLEQCPSACRCLAMGFLGAGYHRRLRRNIHNIDSSRHSEICRTAGTRRHEDEA